MEQKIESDIAEILIRLARLQSDIEHIKSNIVSEEKKEVELEMNAWDEASEEDISNWEKENL